MRDELALFLEAEWTYAESLRSVEWKVDLIKSSELTELLLFKFICSISCDKIIIKFYVVVAFTKHSFSLATPCNY